MQLIIEQCENCRCATYVFGLSRPILICSNKAGREGTFFVISPDEYCKNFKPKEFRAGPVLRTFESDGVKLIPLTRGKFAIVDAEDYDWLVRYKWHCRHNRNKFYAYRNKAGKPVSMHRELIANNKSLLVDHIDGNGLNNRKRNLRVCTHAQNAHNRLPKSNSRSRYKGLSWHKRNKRWEVQIIKSGRKTFIGSFDDQLEAAIAYDRNAERLFREFAYLNFPQLAEFRKFARKIIFSA